MLTTISDGKRLWELSWTIPWSIAYFVKDFRTCISILLFPNCTQALAPSSFLHLTNLAISWIFWSPWRAPPLEWPHLYNINDLYPYHLSCQHSSVVDESLWPILINLYSIFPKLTSTILTWFYYFSKPELHGWTFQLLSLIWQLQFISFCCISLRWYPSLFDL